MNIAEAPKCWPPEVAERLDKGYAATFRAARLAIINGVTRPAFEANRAEFADRIRRTSEQLRIPEDLQPVLAACAEKLMDGTCETNNPTHSIVDVEIRTNLL